MMGGDKPFLGGDGRLGDAGIAGSILAITTIISNITPLKSFLPEKVVNIVVPAVLIVGIVGSVTWKVMAQQRSGSTKLKEAFIWPAQLAASYDPVDELG